MDGVEGTALPSGHALEDLVGDGGDGLAGDLGAIELRQDRWRAYLALQGAGLEPALPTGGVVWQVRRSGSSSWRFCMPGCWTALV
ncbi:hypothetical protein AQJ23_01095 [Streptomyces antibioticus]|nr:hypothetical protein AQJ23_01095 [Streptomyces antibioticus]